MAGVPYDDQVLMKKKHGFPWKIRLKIKALISGGGVGLTSHEEICGSRCASHLRCVENFVVFFFFGGGGGSLHPPRSLSLTLRT